MESIFTTLGEASKYPPEEQNNDPYPKPSPQLNSSVDNSEDSFNSEGEHLSKRTQNRVYKSTITQHLPIHEALCPVTGANHSHLLQFDIHICPRCYKNIYDDLEEDDKSEKGTKSTDKIPTTAPSGETMEGNIKFEVEYLDQISKIRDDVSWFRRKASKEIPWDGPFDLAKARQGIKVHPRKTIVKIKTILVIDHPDDDDRSDGKRIRIVREGLMNDPRVQFKSIKQQMTIRSKAIIEALQKIVTYYPRTNVNVDTLVLKSPFCILAHHLTELETCTRIAFDHIGQLLRFLRSDIYGNEIDIERARHSKTPPMCTFPLMWLLYKPGTTVYITEESIEAGAYVVAECEVDPELLQTDKLSRSYRLALWNLNSDGMYVRRSRKTKVVGYFDGERPILDLQVIPADFVDASDGGKTRKKLIERGRKWYEMLKGGQQWHYHGQTYSFDKKVIDTRVVIDIDAYFQHNKINLISENFMINDMGDNLAICPCERCRGGRPHPPRGFPWAEYDIVHPRHDDLEFSGNHPNPKHRYLLCVGNIGGLALRTRTWEKLDVELCYPPTINTKAIDTLVMPDERKRMIKAIVQKYTDPRFTPGTSVSTWGADFIEKKGEGQIFLLHGGPECISELIGRPLLSLTCADFGTNEEVMEDRLSRWFKLAEKWGAVMLLDEADVWLERRMISDLKRNTLVAVFLRCLEYYRGILFLTSNRVGTFDDAFISRVHVVIKYEDLGEPERKQIWKQFFDKLERERKDTILVESRAKHFVMNDSEMKKIPWNGREIRNAFQTAVSLAEYRYHYEGGKEESDTIVLDKVDFEQVCQMSIDFKDYLKRVHRGDDENDRAMRERARA
ncbi:uncharacterized protein GGS22DRAFT_180406 [Annulohypoxylon maeteangense]|uniref:uncharacterized protein n=1 Tax=Annulohypoxylon maeteangense TaxID=1927788 RepID=UPI002007A5C8|nr:uncharacterized protein GGS22DRAFT_180406 [Annulohypoxylon maeteangense]KAI0883764.1 hypothetical protein GGS22DRAFT_180406 [Annulohypoxylon maeteangense]